MMLWKNGRLLSVCNRSACVSMRYKHKGTTWNQRWPLQGFAPEGIKQTTALLRHARPPKAQPFGRQLEPHSLQSLMLYEEVIDEKAEAERLKKQEEGKLEVILTKYIEEYGERGDVVEVPKTFGRRELILSGAAVYASDFNRQLFAATAKPKGEETHVRANLRSLHLARLFDRIVLPVHVHRGQKVTTWHVQKALRRKGVYVAETSVLLSRPNVVSDDENDRRMFEAIVLIDNQVLAQLIFRLHLVISAAARSDEMAQNIILEKKQKSGEALIDEIERLLNESSEVTTAELTANGLQRMPHYVHAKPSLTRDKIAPIVEAQKKKAEKERLEQEEKRRQRFAQKPR